MKPKWDLTDKNSQGMYTAYLREKFPNIKTIEILENPKVTEIEFKDGFIFRTSVPFTSIAAFETIIELAERDHESKRDLP